MNDSDSGLIYMQQRYYEPILTRFLSTDPVATDANTGGNFGRYTYVGNDPLDKTDPTGRVLEVVGDKDFREKTNDQLKN